MGHVHVTAKLKAKRTLRVRFLVDTGATFAVIPPSLATRIGAVLSTPTFSVKLADGRRRRLRACTVVVRIGTREGPVTTLVMPGSEPILGVESLEGLGLKGNPSRGRVEPTRSAAALLVGMRRG